MPGLGETRFSTDEVRAGYFRRPGAPEALPIVTGLADREYCEQEWASILLSLYTAIGNRWLNSPMHIAMAEDKPITLGLPGGAHFSTASSTGVLSKVFGIPSNSPDLKPVAASTPPALRYPFRSLSIGGVVMNNPAIDIYQQDGDLLCGDEWVQSRAKRCYGGVQLQLGLDKIETLRL